MKHLLGLFALFVPVFLSAQALNTTGICVGAGNPNILAVNITHQNQLVECATYKDTLTADFYVYDGNLTAGSRWVLVPITENGYTAGPLTGSGTQFLPFNVLNNSINDTYIAQNTIDSTELQAGGIAFSDIAQNGATLGQYPVWNGTKWVTGRDVSISQPSQQILYGTGVGVSSSPGATYNPANSEMRIAGPITVDETLKIWHGSNNNSTNIAVGDSTLLSTTGSGNTALGNSALRSVRNSGNNTALGLFALRNLRGPGSIFPSAPSNFATAVGYYAGEKYKWSFDGTFLGYAAGRECDSCNFITALGYSALGNTRFSEGASATGWGAGANVDTVILSTFNGYGAGRLLWRSRDDLFLGYEAGLSTNSVATYSFGNVYAGYRSGFDIRNTNRNVAIGWRSADQLRNGEFNTILGANCGNGTTAYDRATVIGANVPVPANDYAGIYIGNGTGTIKFSNTSGETRIADPVILTSYNTGSITGTPTHLLGVTNTGRVVHSAFPSQPNGQVVVGTGSGMSSYPELFYNNTTQQLNVGGHLQLGSGATGIIKLTNGDRMLWTDSDFTYLTVNNERKIWIGGVADRTNYYDNNSHRFRNSAGSSTLGFLNSSGFSLGNGTVVRARLDVSGQGTTSSTWAMQVHNSTNNSNILMARDDGNVGINTATPGQRLHVVGSVRLQSLPTRTTETNVLWADANGVLALGAAPAGVSTIGAVQSAANTNAASISGSDLRLHAANQTNPGILVTGVQDIPEGNKTFYTTGTGFNQKAIELKNNANATGNGITFPMTLANGTGAAIATIQETAGSTSILYNAPADGGGPTSYVWLRPNRVTEISNFRRWGSYSVTGNEDLSTGRASELMGQFVVSTSGNTLVLPSPADYLVGTQFDIETTFQTGTTGAISTPVTAYDEFAFSTDQDAGTPGDQFFTATMSVGPMKSITLKRLLISGNAVWKVIIHN